MRLLCLAAPAILLAACGPAAAPPAASPAVVGPTPTPLPQAFAVAGSSPPGGLPFLTAAPAALGADRVAFKLFKFLGETGAERDTYVAIPGGGVEVKALFSYRDRMSTVPLAASFAIGPDGSLRRYVAWGKTSRFTTIDDRVVAHGDTIEVTREDGHTTARTVPSGVVGVASGYAPMLAQDLLVREWGQRGRPRTMPLLPEGEATIESRGKETYENGKEKVTLEHIAVGGLVWGREDAWIGEDGTLVAVVTRDAEFDHSEAVREGFDAILPKLAKSTGTDGVAWLAQQATGLRQGTGSLAFVGATVIDGTGGPPLKDAVVVVDGDRIVAVGPRASVAVPAGATSIDVAGKYIVPGLWDMHAHVEQVEQGAVYLAAGVTTVRDMGNILDFITGMRDAIDAGGGFGPRILVDGLVDGEGPAALGTVRIASRDQIAPTIDRFKKAGCPEVKIYSSVAPDLVRPIVAYAHAHGMRAVGHVPEGMTSAEAVAAGYDSISHITYLLDAVLPSKERRSLSRARAYERMATIDLASPAMAKLLARVAARHVVIDDTMALEEQILHTPEEDAKREPGIATLPKELEATLGGVPPALAPAADAAFEKLMGLLGELHRRHIPVVAGTDISVPGHSLLRELELYVKAGWTPMEAIEAATSLPAKVMHLDRELGTLEAGKRADLVVLDADPLADIHNVRTTALVVTRGKAYAPGGLWKLVGFRPATRR